MNRVCTIIVTYNRLELLKGTICAVQKQSYKSDVVVVNNGSTDGTLEYLESLQDIIAINQSNLGGAGGFFVGIKYAVENDYDYVWIMDDDVLPSKDSLEMLTSELFSLEEEDKIGFVCSKVVNLDGDPVNLPQINTKQKATGYPFWCEKLEDGIVRVSSATFVSVLFPCSIVLKVGLPFKEFFIWGDDTEFTLRISKLYPCYLVGKSIVKHLRIGGGSLSFYQLKNRKRIKMFSYFYRNRFYLYRKGYGELDERLLFYLSCTKLLFKLLLHLSFYKINIIISSLIKSFFFNPKIVYVKKKSE
ncbi:MAG: glycosyltransferase family 2 protein [Bacteroides sp.]|jgi:GT2 family glycosyltransferase|nr:glycosyltransferase family 2 protein [Bacteroides sp.]MCI1682742.1 glycosyltransferase family 2 protein [Bacteroides sp.]